jgi:hypothetical protein
VHGLYRNANTGEQDSTREARWLQNLRNINHDAMIALLWCCLPRLQYFKIGINLGEEFVSEVFSSAADGSIPVLRCLETAKFSDWDTEIGLDPSFFLPFQVLSSMRHLEGWVVANNRDLEKSELLPAQSSVKTLVFRNANISASVLGTIILYCKALESFTFEFAGDDSDDVYFSGPELLEALLTALSTLHHLECRCAHRNNASGR